MTAGGVAQEFRPDPAAASKARRFLRAALDELGPEETARELADLLIAAANEFATNAVIHARTEFTVRVLLGPAEVRVEVSDENSRLPQPCMAPADATSGRGLAIVDGTGLAWGVERHSGGKTLWVQAARVAPPAPVSLQERVESAPSGAG
ncbi:MAG: ATP-binding protein [Trebonia sp.]